MCVKDEKQMFILINFSNKTISSPKTIGGTKLLPKILLGAWTIN
jgi:hypothetical protein